MFRNQSLNLRKLVVFFYIQDNNTSFIIKIAFLGIECRVGIILDNKAPSRSQEFSTFESYALKFVTLIIYE